MIYDPEVQRFMVTAPSVDSLISDIYIHLLVDGDKTNSWRGGRGGGLNIYGSSSFDLHEFESSVESSVPVDLINEWN